MTVSAGSENDALVYRACAPRTALLSTGGHYLLPLPHPTPPQPLLPPPPHPSPPPSRPSSTYCTHAVHIRLSHYGTGRSFNYWLETTGMDGIAGQRASVCVCVSCKRVCVSACVSVCVCVTEPMRSETFLLPLFSFLFFLSFYFFEAEVWQVCVPWRESGGVSWLAAGCWRLKRVGDRQQTTEWQAGNGPPLNSRLLKTRTAQLAGQL